MNTNKRRGWFVGLAAALAVFAQVMLNTVLARTEWQTVTQGLELRTDTPEGNFLGQMRVVRVNPAYYTVRAHYSAGQPYSLDEWRAQLPDAVAIINANFFDRQDRTLGLLISDGTAYGTSYTQRGGTFAILNDTPVMTYHLLPPYSYAGEPYTQAVQAFPMLLWDSQVVFADTRRDRATRRTVIALDDQGRIVLVVTPLQGMTLRGISAYLAASDLRLVSALNLDGGGSSMLYVADGDAEGVTIHSFDPMPSVLAVYAR
jgi:exopolysaccharide biosynthesis protein